MRRMDRSVVWRSGLVQAAAVAVVAVALGAALPTSFFEEWGWLAGPAAWLACALLTARVVGLPWAPVLAGAALAGLPGLVGVALDVHWLGAAVGIPLFALWCGRLARDRDLLREVV
jgi:hypothetical protein